MKELIFYIVLFIICYLFYIIFVYKRKNVFDKFKDGKEIKYLKIRYKIKVNDKNINKLSNVIFITNSFIISSTVLIISLVKSLLLQVLISFEE